MFQILARWKRDRELRRIAALLNDVDTQRGYLVDYETRLVRRRNRLMVDDVNSRITNRAARGY